MTRNVESAISAFVSTLGRAQQFADAGDIGPNCAQTLRDAQVRLDAVDDALRQSDQLSAAAGLKIVMVLRGHLERLTYLLHGGRIH